jgi:hypothetical protein
MWGYCGEWPVTEAMEFLLDDSAFFRFRRLVRSKAISLARCRKPFNAKSLLYARRMLRSNDRIVSRVRGLSRFECLGDSLSLLSVAQSFGRISQ